GESGLTYRWVASNPPAAVIFGANGLNSAKDTTATLTAPGFYTFQVTIADLDGLTTTSTVTLMHILGDADHNGIVNSIDFTALALHFNQVGRTWSQGDFN